MFEPIKRILPQVVASHHLSGQLKVRRVLEEVPTVMKALWGEERAHYLHPVSFKDGVLKLEASAPAAKQQAAQDAVRIMNELNRRVGEKCVVKLEVKARGF